MDKKREYPGDAGGDMFFDMCSRIGPAMLEHLAKFRRETPEERWGDYEIDDELYIDHLCAVEESKEAARIAHEARIERIAAEANMPYEVVEEAERHRWERGPDDAELDAIMGAGARG